MEWWSVEMGCVSYRWLANGSNLWLLSQVKKAQLSFHVSFWAGTRVITGVVSGTFHFLRFFSSPREGEIHSQIQETTLGSKFPIHLQSGKGALFQKKDSICLSSIKTWKFSSRSSLPVAFIVVSQSAQKYVASGICELEVWMLSHESFFYHREVFWVGCWCQD